MKNIYTLILLASVLTVSNSKIVAQENLNQHDYEKICISILPQYTFIGGIRADVDLRLGDTKNWLILSPQVYANRNDNLWRFNFDRMDGFGLMVSHRYYISQEMKPSGLYIQYGAAYNYTSIQGTGDGWIETQLGGSDAITTGEVTLHDKVHKFGGDMVYGFQVSPHENFLLDFYTGVGFRSSIITLNESGGQSINGGILSPAYSGFLLIGGIRIGVYF